MKTYQQIDKLIKQIEPKQLADYLYSNNYEYAIELYNHIKVDIADDDTEMLEIVENKLIIPTDTFKGV